MTKRTIREFDEALALFGGTVKAAKLFRVTPAAVSQWRIKKQFPLYLYPEVMAQLEKRRVIVPSTFWAFFAKRKRRASPKADEHVGAAQSV